MTEDESDSQTNTNGLSITRQDEFDAWTWSDIPFPKNFIQNVSISAAEAVTDEICENSEMEISTSDDGEMIVQFMAFTAQLILSMKFGALVDQWISVNITENGGGMDLPVESYDEALIIIEALESALAKIREAL